MTRTRPHRADNAADIEADAYWPDADIQTLLIPAQTDATPLQPQLINHTPP